jgi:hypothetical protein
VISERKIFFVGLGIFLFIVFIFFSIWNIRTSHSFLSTLNQLEHLELPNSLSELSSGINLEKSENAAIVLTNVFNFVSKSSTNLASNELSSIDELISLIDTNTLSQRRLSLKYSDLTPQDIVKLKALLSDGDVLSVLQSLYASSMFNEASFDVESMIDWQSAGEFMSCTKLMCLNAYISALDGNADKAISELTASLRIMNLFAEMPSVPVVLVRFAGINQIVDTFEQIIDLISINDLKRDLLMDFLVELNRSSSLNSSSLISALDGEFILGRETFKSLLYADVDSEDLKKRGIDKIYVFLMRYPFGCVLKSDFTQFLKNIIEIRKSAKKPFFSQEDALRIKADTPFWASSSSKTLPHLLSCLRYMYICNAKVDMARIGTGLELFNEEIGRYPFTLSVKSIIPENNNLYDPFSEKYYRYISLTNSYKLYSVGPNMIDDGGVEIGSQGQLLDCVWR